MSKSVKVSNWYNYQFASEARLGVRGRGGEAEEDPAPKRKRLGVELSVTSHS